MLSTQLACGPAHARQYCPPIAVHTLSELLQAALIVIDGLSDVPEHVPAILQAETEQNSTSGELRFNSVRKQKAVCMTASTCCRQELVFWPPGKEEAGHKARGQHPLPPALGVSCRLDYTLHLSP